MSAAAAETADQIPEKMQAVICHGPENYALEQVAVPTPGPGRRWSEWRPSASAPAT